MAAPRFPHTAAANKYARDVVAGRVAAGGWVKAACRRHLEDLKREQTRRFPYRFDRERAERVCKFAECLPHTKGKWASVGQKLKLEPWQKFILASIFGWVREDGRRRFRESYLEIPRKNGKSSLAAVVGLYCLVADGEFGAEVYSGATTEKQAWEVFRPARLMAMRTPALCARFGIEVNAGNLALPHDGSRFEPLIGNPGDGSSPSCAIVDEYHEHDRPDLYDTMVTGMGAREQPLMFVITTAGSNIAGPCYEKRVAVQKVLDGVFVDEETFGVIYTIDPEDDWTDPKNLRKANPNYGVSVSADYLKSQLTKAIQSPSQQGTFRTKHLNVWVGARNAAINAESWRRCGNPDLRPEDFKDCESVLAVDLASRIDMAAVVHIFYRDEDDGRKHYYLFPKFYVPEGALLTSKNGDRYAAWARQGVLDLVEGEEIDFNQIEQEIIDLSGKYQIVEMPYDPWQATQLAQTINEQARGIPVEFRNTVGNMSPAFWELLAAIESGRLHHPDNPILNWHASNVTAREDAKGNIFPRKELPESKIDGIVAAIMGIGRASVRQQKRSVYESRGLI